MIHFKNKLSPEHWIEKRLVIVSLMSIMTQWSISYIKRKCFINCNNWNQDPKLEIFFILGYKEEYGKWGILTQ